MDGHKYTDIELKRMQKISLEMLIEVDRICRKCNISYELDGGTLLGAVRHKGFIPWDDDCDVRMMQSEYERFREACRTELDRERFFLQDYYTDRNYRWGYSKLLRKGTDFRRVGQDMLKMHRGVFMDIFNCVNMPEGRMKRELFNKACFVVRKLGYAPLGAENEQNSMIRLLYKVLAKIPISVVHAGYEMLNSIAPSKPTKLVRVPGWHHTQEDEGYLRRWMDERCELEFEGHMFYAPKDYDGYLRMEYGDDYMTPPPVEKQSPDIMASYLDLGKCGL